MEDVGPEALDLLTVEEVATRLRLSPKTIRRLYTAEDNEPGTGIEAVRVGTRRLIAPEAVLAYKKRLRREASEMSAAQSATPDAA